MFTIVGLVIVMGAMFGVFAAHGGDLTPIIKAAPFELASIGGAAVGAMLMGNSMDIVKGVAGGFGKVDRFHVVHLGLQRQLGFDMAVDDALQRRRGGHRLA